MTQQQEPVVTTRIALLKAIEEAAGQHSLPRELRDLGVAYALTVGAMYGRLPGDIPPPSPPTTK